MHSIPKLTIIVPIFILIAAIFLRVTSPPAQQTMQPLPVIPDTTTSSNERTVQSTPKPIQRLNLQGPYSCAYNAEDVSMKAFIQDRKIYAKIVNTEKTTQFLLIGDCLYTWEMKEQTGTKMCGLGQYISLFESFSSMPFLSSDMIVSMISGFQSSAKLDAGAVNGMLNSCVKNTIDPILFELPKTVHFVEGKISGIPKE